MKKFKNIFISFIIIILYQKNACLAQEQKKINESKILKDVSTIDLSKIKLSAKTSSVLNESFIIEAKKSNLYSKTLTNFLNDYFINYKPTNTTKLDASVEQALSSFANLKWTEVTINSTPTGASVTINGQDQQATTIFQQKLMTGIYHCKLSLAGYKDTLFVLPIGFGNYETNITLKK